MKTGVPPKAPPDRASKTPGRSFQIAAGMSNIFVRMRADACENEGRVTIFGPGQAILKPAREKERAAADPALPADQARSRSWKRTRATRRATAE